MFLPLLFFSFVLLGSLLWGRASLVCSFPFFNFFIIFSVYVFYYFIIRGGSFLFILLFIIIFSHSDCACIQIQYIKLRFPIVTCSSCGFIKNVDIKGQPRNLMYSHKKFCSGSVRYVLTKTSRRIALKKFTNCHFHSIKAFLIFFSFLFFFGLSLFCIIYNLFVHFLN